MILYFSGSGNSLSAAKKIAEATNDNIMDIGQAFKTNKLDFFVEQGENLGFVFPVYAWTTPRIIDEVLQVCNFVTDNRNPFTPGYCYCVLTCGSQVGGAADFFEKMLMKYVGIKLDAAYSITCVGNCVTLYSPATGTKMREKLLNADKQTEAVVEQICRKDLGHFENRGVLGRAASKMTCREDKPPVDITPFHVDPALCTGCGICEAVCPTNTVLVVNGVPEWAGENCTECYACLHRCPTAASQYGDKTAARPRYCNPVLRGVKVIDPRSIPSI